MLAKGQLNMEFDCESNVKEVIQLRDSLQFAVVELARYVKAISYDMEQFADGNMILDGNIGFLGDFKPIGESIAAFSENISKVKETAETLTTIVEITENIAKKMQKVTANTGKIAEETRQVKEETQSINESVMSTSAVWEENYASSTELANQASILKELTQKFQLKNA